MKTREIESMNTIELPAFFPVKLEDMQNFNMTTVYKSKRGRTIKLLGTITEVYSAIKT